MKKKSFSNLLVFIGLFLFDLLFWNEMLGINTLIFTLFSLFAMNQLFPERRNSKPVIYTAIGTLVSAIMVVWHHSTFAQFIHLFSFMTLVGFVHQSNLSLLIQAFFSSMLNLIDFPRKLERQFNSLGVQSKNLKGVWYNTQLVFIPSLIIGIFYILYYHASQEFADLSDVFWSNFLSLFQWDISVTRILFLIMGLLIVGNMFWPTELQLPFRISSGKHQGKLIRWKNPQQKKKHSFGLMDLKNEYRMGVGLIIALNVLLFIVNLTDLRSIWFGEAPKLPHTLKAYVHEGTYLLIAAILLAMAVLIFLFRKNLNFFPNNQLLKFASYCWLIQNTLLAMSVGMRNFRYIEYCGLAYKRIGVIIFLALTLYGLWTMYIKLESKKNIWFLWHRNSWAVYLALILTTCVNWDVFITRHNIQANTTNGIDLQFLLQVVSEKNLYILEENKAILEEKGFLSSNDYSIPMPYLAYIEKGIEEKRKTLERKKKTYSWLSWNYADYRNWSYLEK